MSVLFRLVATGNKGILPYVIDGFIEHTFQITTYKSLDTER